MISAAVFALATLASAIVTRLAIPVLRRIGAVDVPNARSVHSHVAVRGVGVGPLITVVAGMAILVAIASVPLPFIVIAGAASAVAVVGLIDDLRGLGVAVRLAATTLVSALACAALVAFGLTVPWVPFAVLYVVASINIANFMDGIDGISGVNGVLVGATFTATALVADSPAFAVWGALMAGAFAGFLPWNVFKRGIFLGDAGSYLLGGLTGLSVVVGVTQGLSALALVGPLVPYFADTSFTLLRRLAQRKKWSESHREHLYQRLGFERLGHARATLFVAAASGVAATIGVFAAAGTVPWWVALAIMVVVGVVYVVVARRLLAVPGGATAGDSEDAERRARTSQGRSSISVVGGSGFVGSAILDGLVSRGSPAAAVPAPRLELAPRPRAAIDEWPKVGAPFERLLDGSDVVINAAGVADPDGRANPVMFGANAALPVALARAAEAAGARLFIHISSAAVQGRRPVLDESEVAAPFSAYSKSKAVGEAALLEWTRSRPAFAQMAVVVVRATSVQAPHRSTSAGFRRFARSRFSSVAGDGRKPTMLSSASGLGDLVAEICAYRGEVPQIVLQPWEGLSAAEALRIAGGREPLHLPRLLCRLLIALGYIAATGSPRLRGNVRRIEVAWMGQAQVPGWAAEARLRIRPAIRDVLRDGGVV